MTGMGWDWTDQAHADAQRRGLEAGMEGNLAEAFKQQAIEEATTRREPRAQRPNNSGPQFRLILFLLGLAAVGFVLLMAWPR